MIDFRKKTGAGTLGFVLALICAVSTALMAWVYSMTKNPISEIRTASLAASFKLVLPEFDNDILSTRAELGNKTVLYTAMKGGTIIGYAVQSSVTTGYGGNVTGLTGFDSNGKILNVIITEHNETPGLGSKAASRTREKTITNIWKKTDTSALPPNVFLDSFKDHTALGNDVWSRPWHVRADGGQVDQISGATISSRAVTNVAWEAASKLAAYLQQQKGK